MGGSVIRDGEWIPTADHIRELEAERDALQRRVSELEKTLQAVAATDSADAEENEALQRRVAELEAARDALQRRVAFLESQIATTGDVVGEQWDALQRRVDELEEAIRDYRRASEKGYTEQTRFAMLWAALRDEGGE